MQPWSQPLLWGSKIHDPYWSDVVLLVGFEGVNGATSGPGFTDESSRAHGAASSVSGAIDTSQFKFGASSLYSTLVSSCVQWPASSDWHLSSANSDQFTVECWIRPSSLSIDAEYIGVASGAGTFQWQFRLLAIGELQFNLSTDGSTYAVAVTTSGAGIVANTWYHTAIDKDATGKIRVYSNGTMLASNTPANSVMFNSSTVIAVMAHPGSNGFQGWIDEVRVTKGIARYASDSGFAVPTTAFPRS